jgi:dUTPase
VVLINLNLPDELFIKDDPAAMAFGSMFGSKKDFRISTGDRIAQIIIEKCYETNWSEVNTLPNSERGTKGFGSSGK